VRSPRDSGTLVIQVVDTELFLQFTGGPSGIQMDFPLITQAQRAREPRIRRFFEARQLHVRTTFGSDRSQFLDIDLAADPAFITTIAEAALAEIFDVRPPIELAFMGEGWGVAA